MSHDEFICTLIGRTQNILLKNYKAETRKFDLTPMQLGVLRKLYEEEDGLNASELVKRLLSDSSTMMLVIDHLEEKGLVKRQTDPNDRRVYHIILTEKAKKILPEAIEQTDKVNKFIHDNFSDKEIKTLRSCLIRIYDHVSAIHNDRKKKG